MTTKTLTDQNHTSPVTKFGFPKFLTRYVVSVTKNKTIYPHTNKKAELHSDINTKPRNKNHPLIYETCICENKMNNNEVIQSSISGINKAIKTLKREVKRRLTKTTRSEC